MYLTGQHLEEGGFAGTVRANDAPQLTAPDREINIVIGEDAAIALGETLSLQYQFAVMHGPAPVRRRRQRGDCVRIGLGWFAVPDAAHDDLPQRYESADDAATQEHDQQNEDDTKHQLPGGAKMQRRLQEIAEIEPHSGADQRSEQGAGAADRSLHHKLA